MNTAQHSSSFDISHALPLHPSSFNIMTNCWQQLPKDRLTFAVIHQTLRKYMQRQNISSYIRMSEVESYPMDFEAEETTIGGRDTVEMCNVPEEVFT